MAPTFITSFFGMNFKLPFETFPGYWPVIIASILCLLSVFVCSWMLNFNRETFSALKKAKKMKRKQRKLINTEKKKIKKQEKKLK